MADKSLTFNIFGKDVSASSTMKKVGDAGEGTGNRLHAAGLAIGVGLAAASGAAIKFGVDSIKAFSDASEKQAELQFAFKKFPALADTNQKALQSLNSALQLHTRFDDDDIAGAQAVLAQYKLNGEQLKELTPLMLDYAQKTGKDLPTEAEDLGKALLGQGRGLKAIGVNFKDTGTEAGNFSQLVGDLRTQVGGLAVDAGETAAGKVAILQNQFGELEESVGSALLPILQQLVPVITDMCTWLSQNTWVLGPLAAAIGVATTAQWGLNLAMDSNPVGAVILGIVSLTAALLWLRVQMEAAGIDYQNFTVNAVVWSAEVGQAVHSMGLDFQSFAVNVVVGSAQAGASVHSMGLDFQSFTTNIVVWFAQAGASISNMLRSIPALFGLAFNSAANQVRSAFAGIVAYIQYVVNGIIGSINSVIRSINAVGAAASALTGGVINLKLGTLPHMATGGVVPHVPGGVPVVVGEGRYDEAIVPLDGQHQIPGQSASGGDVHIHVTGTFLGTPTQLWNVIVDGMKRGDIPRNAFSSVIV